MKVRTPINTINGPKYSYKYGVKINLFPKNYLSRTLFNLIKHLSRVKYYAICLRVLSNNGTIVLVNLIWAQLPMMKTTGKLWLKNEVNEITHPY